MSFASFNFLLFTAVVCIIYYLLPSKLRWTVLLGSSLVFFYMFSGFLVAWVIVTVITVYLAGIAMSRIDESFEKLKPGLAKEERKAVKNKFKKKKRMVLTSVLILNFGILFAFKYLGFFSSIINSLSNLFAGKTAIPLFVLIAPVGISFYMLQATSYIIDVYMGKYKADKNLGRVALFICFFPQIVEGPISRYNVIAEDLYSKNKFDYYKFTSGCQLMLWGFFKKLVVADRIAILVNEVFDNYNQYKGITVLLAIVLYTAQIYADFSGCIDIVRGTAGLFGVTLQENFKAPFFSKSINEFWRRWHITLGAWLRDYIFYPVSMSKVFVKLSKKTRERFNDHFAKLIPLAFATFFVWFGNGLWHGGSVKYIVYGLYYYVLIMLGVTLEPLLKNIQTKKLKINDSNKLFMLWQTLRTLIIVFIGMLIFRAETLLQAFNMFTGIFRISISKTILTKPMSASGYSFQDLAVVAVSIILIIAVDAFHEKGISLREAIAERNIIVRWIIFIFAFFIILFFGMYGIGYNAADFIYGAF